MPKMNFSVGKLEEIVRKAVVSAAFSIAVLSGGCAAVRITSDCALNEFGGAYQFAVEPLLPELLDSGLEGGYHSIEKQFLKPYRITPAAIKKCFIGLEVPEDERFKALLLNLAKLSPEMVKSVKNVYFMGENPFDASEGAHTEPGGITVCIHKDYTLRVLSHEVAHSMNHNIDRTLSSAGKPVFTQQWLKLQNSSYGRKAKMCTFLMAFAGRMILLQALGTAF